MLLKVTDFLLCYFFAISVDCLKIRGLFSERFLFLWAESNSIGCPPQQSGFVPRHRQDLLEVRISQSTEIAKK